MNENVILQITKDEQIILNEVLLHALDDNSFNYDYTICIEDLLNKIEAEQNWMFKIINLIGVISL